MLVIFVNVLWIPAAVITSMLLTLLFRRKQLQKNKKRIGKLEKEMLANHAEILSLQKEVASLQVIINKGQTPVVSIKEASVSEDKGQKAK